jgi:ribonuclease BN (tRNA processing enzyme)
MHGDHTAGLFEFTDLYNWYFKGDPVVHLPKEGAAELITEWNTGLSHTSKTTFGLVREGAVYDDGTLRVSAVPTTHISNAFSYIVEAEGKRVFFSGDFRIGDTETFLPALSDKSPEILVFETAHIDVRQLCPMIEALGTRRVYFNHVAPNRDESIADLAASLPGVDITVSADGMEIEL